MGYYACTRTCRSDLNKLDHQSPTTVLIHVGGIIIPMGNCVQYIFLQWRLPVLIGTLTSLELFQLKSISTPNPSKQEELYMIHVH